MERKGVGRGELYSYLSLRPTYSDIKDIHTKLCKHNVHIQKRLVNEQSAYRASAHALILTHTEKVGKGRNEQSA